MASWTSALTGFLSGAAGAATTNYPPASDPSLAQISQIATSTIQQQHESQVAWVPPPIIEHIVTPHVHIVTPPAPNGGGFA